jgi:hypothetical protein
MTQQANRVDLTALSRHLPPSSAWRESHFSDIFRHLPSFRDSHFSGILRHEGSLTFPTSSGLKRLSLFRHLPALWDCHFRRGSSLDVHKCGLVHHRETVPKSIHATLVWRLWSLLSFFCGRGVHSRFDSCSFLSSSRLQPLCLVHTQQHFLTVFFLFLRCSSQTDIHRATHVGVI